VNLEQALILLKEKGYKFTNKRQDILELFAAEKRYLTAKDVLEHLKSKYPGLSFDTIYRNIAVYVDLGVLEATELDGERRFRFTCTTKEHHHHLICLDCGKTTSLKSCPMKNIPKNVNGFNVVDHKFEVYGYCQECSD
jgi:Fur family transcriptional regulator, zinc uptake regulator